MGNEADGDLAVGAGEVSRELTNAPIRPPAEPFSEVVFGERIDDPYRWMEQPDRANEVTDFLRRSSDHAVAQLAAQPGRAQLRERVAAGMRSGVLYSDLRESDGRLFYRRTDPDAQLAKLVMRDADGAEHVLYDPEAAEHAGAALNNYSVAPDGATVAFHTAGGGSEIGAIRFLDVVSGNLLPDSLAPVGGVFEASWLDGSAVTYTKITAVGSDDPMQNMRVYVHHLGRSESQALLGAGVDGAPPFDPAEFPVIDCQEGTDWVVGRGLGARANGRILVARRGDISAGHPRWREIAGYEDRVSAAVLLGDVLYLNTTHSEPSGEVVAIDLAAGGTFAQARTVLPASDAIITAIGAGDDGVYVLARTDGISRLFFIEGGLAPIEVPLPIQGSAELSRHAGSGGGVTFVLHDWFTAPRWYRARGTVAVPLGVDSTSFAGMRGARQLRETAISADGTEVPLAILLPPDRRPGPAPTLLVGYGSYGISNSEPAYSPGLFGLLASGGVVAFCGTRGGGERGRDWHEAGRAANKPNAHADLIAGAERLVELGLTRANLLAVTGVSAGGLLAPPAALVRPNLFGALIARVAILNATRLAAAPNGPNQFAEMGDPHDEAGFRALLVQDAYHLLLAAADMPDTLLTVGLNDDRVTPWMSAKWAARALERFGEKRLVLIRADPDTGHGIGSKRDQVIEELTDIYAFVLNRAGTEGFGSEA